MGEPKRGVRGKLKEGYEGVQTRVRNDGEERVTVTSSFCLQ